MNFNFMRLPDNDLPLMMVFLLFVLSGLTLLYLMQQRMGERERRLKSRLKSLRHTGQKRAVEIAEMPMPLPDLYRDEKSKGSWREKGRDRYLLPLLGAITAAVGLGFVVLDVPIIVLLVSAGAVGVAGGAALILHYRRRWRQRQFIDQLPEAIDIIIRGAWVGMSLQENFRVIASEMPDPVGREFRILAEKLAIGIDLERALSAAVENTGAREMQFMATTLVLQRRTGGQYAEVLENLASVLRDRRSRQLKARALTAEARTSARIVAGVTALILLILALTNRTQFDFLLDDPLGNRLLVYSALSLFGGFFAMSRLLGRLK
jgi:Flp pilus assembly protein TadB|tara:strand:- start:45 stop:1004 length:960 start_codon:yes stop_codon:yes gene_type:complete